MISTDFKFEIGKTYRVNPEMVMGLPVFFGEYQGTVDLCAPDGGTWQAHDFLVHGRLVGMPPNARYWNAILKHSEIREAEEA